MTQQADLLEQTGGGKRLVLLSGSEVIVAVLQKNSHLPESQDSSH